MPCAMMLQPLIVIIDPTQQDYTVFVAVANRLRMDTVCFASGQQAIEATPVRKADCWLINQHLTDSEGVEAYDALRIRIDGAPVFIVADSYSIEDERAVLSRGRLHFLCKPLLATEIQDICRIAARAADSAGGGTASTDFTSN